MTRWYYADICQIPGLLLMVDFEKTFGSVAWSFVEKSLTVLTTLVVT